MEVVLFVAEIRSKIKEVYKLYLMSRVLVLVIWRELNSWILSLVLKVVKVKMLMQERRIPMLSLSEFERHTETWLEIPRD